MTAKEALVVVHRSPTGRSEPYNELLTPNGGIAAVGGVAEALGVPCVLMDEVHPQVPDFTQSTFEQIETLLERDQRVFLMATLPGYNSEATMALLEAAKREFDGHVMTGVGGQSTARAAAALARNPAVDRVGVGDAECVLEPMLRGDGEIHRGYLSDRPWPQRAPRFNYHDFVGIRARLDEAERTVVMSGRSRFENTRQLVMQRVRGCAWASRSAEGPCSFCSISHAGRAWARPSEDYVEEEAGLMQDFGVTWIFDASEQFLAFTRAESRAVLEEILAARSRHPGVQWPRRYVAVTAYLLDDEICALLKEVGVEIVFVGLEHFSGERLREMNKGVPKHDFPHRAWLDAAARNGLEVHAGVVVGNRETPESAALLSQGVEWLYTEYPDTVAKVDLSRIHLFAGSRDFERFRETVRSTEARRVIEKLDTNGFIGADDQFVLDRAYIEEGGTLTWEGLKECVARLDAMVARFEQPGAPPSPAISQAPASARPRSPVAAPAAITEAFARCAGEVSPWKVAACVLLEGADFDGGLAVSLDRQEGALLLHVTRRSPEGRYYRTVQGIGYAYKIEHAPLSRKAARILDRVLSRMHPIARMAILGRGPERVG